jgi:hypothetical protein
MSTRSDPRSGEVTVSTHGMPQASVRVAAAPPAAARAQAAGEELADEGNGALPGARPPCRWFRQPIMRIQSYGIFMTLHDVVGCARVGCA